MTSDRLFLDTGFVLAWFNRRDQYHEVARKLAARFLSCAELWTTEAILLEIGAAFSSTDQRPIMIQLWDRFHSEPGCRLAPLDYGLLNRAMDLFRERPDKEWSLADCVSFVVMSDERLTESLSCDHHFVQAGFRALMLE